MISDNLLKIRERVALVCAKAKRDQDAISLVAVTKNRSPEEIREALAAGITDIGENRVQEALLKYNSLSPITQHLSPISWHMVGHLQTNKVKDAVRIFDLIQSLDSLHMASQIDKGAAKISKIQDVLIEVKTSEEATKFGVKPAEVIEVLKEIIKLTNIRVQGLMTIAPLTDNPEKARPYFKRLRELLCEINAQRITHAALRILSMGMTDDFEVAIEEGSTMVRLGRAIFEA